MSSNICFGLVLLLEAAEYDQANAITPPRSPRKDIQASPWCPMKLAYSKPVSSTSPMKKQRTKLDFDECAGAVSWARVSHRHTSTRSFNTPKAAKKSSKCSEGSVHRLWEQVDECAAAASSPSRFITLDTIDPSKEQGKAALDEESFILYDKDDDNHINAVHNIVRRDIWEGFVVDTETTSGTTNNARRTGRIARYDGTVGFRCRFCKHVSLDEQAERAAVYPRSLERIYLANIRFQRDHIE